MIGILFAAALVVACATSLFVTPFVRRLAQHVGMLDVTGERRMHADPKPRIGGIAVYLGFAFALFSTVGFALHSTPIFHDSDQIHSFLGLLFGGTLILGVGVWDDVMGMRPRNKLIAQIAVALVSMIYGFVIPGFNNPFDHNPNTNWIAFPLWVAIPLTLVWYLGMMNAINFIDGLDGLLSGVSAISALSLFIIATEHRHNVVALVLAALIGATLGFLPYNFDPAKIILGDSGALFIGYVFATVSIMGVSKSAIAISLLIPVIVLALPILDTAAAIVRRTRAGRRITEADRGHFHHQLVFRYGLNVRQAVLLIYAVCVVLGAAAVAISGGFRPANIAGIY
jgi:UDP-GlcNAc:undecaprenyl-phosphate GlcNAc-1-phosphate transferase